MRKEAKLTVLFFICAVFSAAPLFAAEQPKIPKGAKLSASVVRAIEELAAKDGRVALRAYYLAADGYQMQGNPKEAVTILEQAAKALPQQEVEILNRQLGLYQQQSNYDKIIQISQSLSRLEPDNFQYPQAAFSACFVKGDKEAAFKVIKDFAKSKPNDINIQTQCAGIFQGKGRQEEAISCLQAASKLKPDDLGLLGQLAQAQLAGNKPSEAKENFQKIYSKAKDAPAKRQALTQIVIIAQQEKAIDGFIAQAEQKIKKNPLDLDAHWELIEASAIVNNPQKSLEALQRASKQFPQEREFNFRLFSSYQMQGKWEEAVSAIKGALAQNPDDRMLKMQYAQALAQAGKLKESIAVLEQLDKLEPGSPYYREQMAEIYSRAKDTRSASKIYEALLAEASEDWRKASYKAQLEQLRKQAK